MKDVLATLKRPVAFSFALVLPFMLMEWINRRSFNLDQLPCFLGVPACD